VIPSTGAFGRVQTMVMLIISRQGIRLFSAILAVEESIMEVMSCPRDGRSEDFTGHSAEAALPH
jgi:hypothetical protein